VKETIAAAVAFLAFLAALFVCVVIRDEGPFAYSVSKDGTVTERVRPVYTREEMPHAGCTGFFRVSGPPQQVGAFEFGHVAWPHKCSVCGATNTFFDARYPQIKTEWKAVNMWGIAK